MRTLIITLNIVVIFLNIAVGQDTYIKLDESKNLGKAVRSQILTMTLAGEIHTASTDLKWRPILTNKCTGFEPESPDQELIDSIKEQKLKLKLQNSNKRLPSSELSTNLLLPVVGTNYLGNVNNGLSPMDNSMAISNGGIIVSVANTTIEYDDINGTNLYYNDLVSFINDPSVTGVCDPVVIYDPGSDRFIFFCQICPLGNNSRILVFFSKTNNPNTGGWWYYNFSGDPLSNGDAFDYPKLAITNNELIITGNLFSQPSGTFDQAVVFQIDKVAGYAGGFVNYFYWNNLNGSPFTLLPVSHGHNSTYGPGMYMVATKSAGASIIDLYELTDEIGNNPSLNHFSVATTAYTLGGDASQSGTSCLLNTGDCRSLSGFYLDGIIHFVFHSEYTGGYYGINYNRLNVASQTNTSSKFGLSGFDYCYPSVVSFTTSATDKSVMIGFGRAGSTIFPEVRAVKCDNSMNWGSSISVKSSSDFVSYTSTTNERWGDYTGTSRKHNSSSVSIWMNGMFSNSSNKWDTWVAEIHDNGLPSVNEVSNQNNFKISPNPVIETFNVNFNLNQKSDLTINIIDISGKLVKELYKGTGLSGENHFSFNKANLSSGTYFLIIKDEKTTFKNEKIIIAD